MILGIGNDLIDVRRVEKTIERYGERFIRRIFTPEALGTGMNRGVTFHDIGVVNLPSGQPALQLTGGALARLGAITPPGSKAILHLSISDDLPLAQAIVVIEARPA